MDFLSVEDRKLFISDAQKKLNLIKFEIEEKLKDEFLELTYFQKQVLEKTMLSMGSLAEFLKNIKVENDG